MSRRYGLRQRRKDRARETELKRIHSYATDCYREAEAALARSQRGLFEATGGHFGLATGTELLVIPESNVRDFRDTTEGDCGRVERTATVSLFNLKLTDDLLDQVHKRYSNYGVVSWRGLAWVITNITIDRDIGYSNGPGIWDVAAHVGEVRPQLELRAVRSAANPLERWAR